MALRNWGRQHNRDGTYGPWQEITTAADGSNDIVWFTVLCQVLLLNLNESPFYANYGIPAHPSVVTQVFPDYYVTFTQQQFAPYFGSLLITKQPLPSPTYNVNVTTHQGVRLNASIPVPY